MTQMAQDGTARRVVGLLAALAIAACGGDGSGEDPPDGSPTGDARVRDAGTDGGGDADVEADAGRQVSDFFRDVELDDYEPIPDVTALPVDDVQMDEALTHWEIRHYDQGEVATLLSAPWSGVGLCGEASDWNDCWTRWQMLTANAGFGPGCEPVRCYYFAALNEGDDVWAVTEADELVSLLGAIDSAAEASLVALARGYRWDPEQLRDGAIRALDDGWELIVWDVAPHEDCDGLRTARYLVHVGEQGRLTVRISAERSCEEGVYL